MAAIMKDSVWKVMKEQPRSTFEGTLSNGS